DLDVTVLVLPRRSELEGVLLDVHVDAEEAEGVAHAGAARRRLEAVVAGDKVVSEDAAVAPAADAEARGIGDAHAYDLVDRAVEVDHLLVPPVGEDRLLERVAAPLA